jgi:regulator of replication initiation timing
MEENNSNQTNNPLKKWVILLAILAMIFCATTLYFGFFAKPIYNVEFIKAQVEKENLQNELDSLLADHNRIKTEYGDLSEQLSEKDSIIMASAAEIKKLINSQGDYYKIKKQLARLQSIAQDYVTQIDQLYTENRALKEENTTIRQTLTKTEEAKAVVESENQNLNAKLSEAAALKAYNVSSKAMYDKRSGEVITEKATRTEKIRTTLLLAENSLIEAGNINIYCRIALPGDGKVLTPGTGDAFTFTYNGAQLQYSCKTAVSYKNQATPVSLTWDLRPGDKAIKGRYIVQVFTDDVYLGETSFDLK